MELIIVFLALIVTILALGLVLLVKGFFIYLWYKTLKALKVCNTAFFVLMIIGSMFILNFGGVFISLRHGRFY